ncbi:cholecystokinin receptor type A-like [Saccostrea cucullata]|uniref:cholecystokinin receptor type A-like n=1 Tax=Saccostrea cuccullata TaxID=36930 RepID=UPI002ED40F3F
MAENATSPVSLDYVIFHKLQENIAAIVYASVLLLVGVPGNCLVCYIYFRWKEKTSSQIFILSLAIVDLFNCLVTMPTELAMMTNPMDFDFNVICKLSRFFTYLCNTIAALIMIVIAVDRYQRICHPSKTNMTVRHAKTAVGVCFVISVFTTWPALVMYGTLTTVLGSNAFAKNCFVENQFLSSPFVLSYFAFHTIATITIFVIISVLYIFIGLAVYKRWKFRRQFLSSSKDLLLRLSRTNNSRNDLNTPVSMTCLDSVSGTRNTVIRREDFRPPKKQNIKLEKTTFMLFLVTLTYILSFIPFLSLATHRSIHPGEWEHISHAGEVVYQVFIRSYLLNSCVNPIIYSFFNSLFRRECKKMCCNRRHVISFSLS